MSDLPFYRTQMGHRFFEHTMPELVRQITRLNDLLERMLVERATTTATPTEEDHGKGRP
jgi:hypothetical protein